MYNNIPFYIVNKNSNDKVNTSNFKDPVFIDLENDTIICEKSTQTKIPKIIHQIWIGDKSKQPTELMKTWESMNPTWEYKLWTEENIPELFNKNQYDKMRQYCGKADIVRYELLYRYGGVYIDADSECINPLDDFFTEHDSFAVYENEQHKPGLIANGYMGSIQYNKLILYLMYKIYKCTNINVNQPWLITGPQLLTNTINELCYDKCKIYPSHYFIPEYKTGDVYSGSDKIYSTHYWGCTTGYDNIPQKPKANINMRF